MFGGYVCAYCMYGMLRAYVCVYVSMYVALCMLCYVRYVWMFTWYQCEYVKNVMYVFSVCMPCVYACMWCNVHMYVCNVCM